MPSDFIISFIFATAAGLAAWWLAGRRWRKVKTTRGEGTERGWMLDICRLLGDYALSVFPGQWSALRRRDTERLVKAGLFPKWDCEELVGAQICGALYGVMFAVLLFPDNTFILLVVVVLGLWLPRWYVGSKRKERQLDIIREFPTAIDMMVLGLEGGLDVGAGIREMVENSEDTPLRREFQRVYQEIAMGESRAVALKQFSQRVDSMEIRAVIMTLVQAIEMGSEIGPMLKTQSEQLRFNRLARAEEAANKAPTKMMIPMALFILPCIFLVIFAPIAISLIQSFGQLGR